LSTSLSFKNSRNGNNDLIKEIDIELVNIVGNYNQKSLKHKKKVIQEKVYIRDGRSPIPISGTTSKIMSSIKRSNTKPELIVRNALWGNGIRGYRVHWKGVPGTPDISFPGKKIAVFINGCFWHRCPHCNPNLPKSHLDFWKEKFDRNIERDKAKIKELSDLGWKSLTIWECQVRSDLVKYIHDIKVLIDESN
jgi:DNA mismatch endonuclease (patch repair protein)